ncbi:MAG TPA: ribonucleoside-diphosphate reductase subunit alpha, partial [Gammaproteobacteria bacterium]|nr:ribonucleoside-diphosphate reductase subunit alpha [Gammaproteobacteria bacterium]
MHEETVSAGEGAPGTVVPPTGVRDGVADDGAVIVPGGYRVIRRNGKITTFDGSKIAVAITKAFLAVEGSSAAASRRIHETVEQLTGQIVNSLTRRMPGGGTVHIEDIQDQVELALMRGGHHKVARAYVLYREERARERQAQEAKKSRGKKAQQSAIKVVLEDGSSADLDRERIEAVVEEACAGLEGVDGAALIRDALHNLYDGMLEREVAAVLVMTARGYIERDPDYSHVAARLLLDSMRREALAFLGCQPASVTQKEMAERYPEYFASYIRRGVELELLDEELTRYDLERLGAALRPERDHTFTYLGLQTLYDRYFIHSREQRFELPQAFFMRVAMGLAINEVEREQRAIEFYDLLSSFDFMSSTPTLFN